MKTFIVIPAYNESKHIGSVLKSLKIFKLPIIVVDDGSKDKTFEVASRLKVTVLRHKINLGKGAALKTGSEAAFLMGAQNVIILDADGQHSLDDLPKFIDALNTQKYDIIFGTRNSSLGIPLVRYLGNKFASILISTLFGIYVSDLICGYRAYTKKAFLKMDWSSVGYGVETEMVIRTGQHKLKYCEVSVETIYYDKFKGVTILDAFGILFNVVKWRISK